MDTAAVILAVASPPGRSCRGIVRLSGRRTFDLLGPHLDDGSEGRNIAARGLRPAVLRVGRREIACVLLALPGPRSYTAEDGAELHLPGNPALLEAVVDALIASARDRELEARRAGPGEFTLRAFLRGRLDLTEAEGVAAMIAARSDAELAAARMLLEGTLGAFARDSADDLASALALVEAGIDFTDQEDVVPIGAGDLRTRLASLRERLADRLRRRVGLEQLEAIPWVVLTGPPNAGKSTLFNALLGRDRAVVSHEPGTTRDVLVEPLLVPTEHGPAEVMLVDLAGADAPGSDLDRAMQAAADAALARAELVLHCEPVRAGTAPAAAIDPGASRPPSRAPVMRIATKADLAATDDDAETAALAVSAATGAGVEALRAAVGTRLEDRAVSLAGDALVMGRRHEEAIRTAVEGLDEALAVCAGGPEDGPLRDVELVASSMRGALDALALLAGDVSPDDVLGRVFAGFCVGK